MPMRMKMRIYCSTRTRWRKGIFTQAKTWSPPLYTWTRLSHYARRHLLWTSWGYWRFWINECHDKGPLTTHTYRHTISHVYCSPVETTTTLPVFVANWAIDSSLSVKSSHNNWPCEQVLLEIFQEFAETLLNLADLIITHTRTLRNWDSSTS